MSDAIEMITEETEVAPKAPEPTKEEREAALVQEVLKSKAIKDGEAAAAILNKGNAKTFEAWTKVGRALVTIGEMANENNRVIKPLIDQHLPQLAVIPSAIRSNAKWLAQNLDEVAQLREEGRLKGDHPTSIREQYRNLPEKKPNPKPKGEAGEEGGEGGDGNPGNDDEAAKATMDRLRAFLDGMSAEGLHAVLITLAEEMVAKPSTRKMLEKQIPKD